MFPTSTQLKYWTFSGNSEIQRLKVEVNKKYIESQHKDGATYNSEFYLNTDEEVKICQHYEYVLLEFCTKFQPPMPRYVLGTAMAFFKRFYLHNSVMDYHPQDIVYTCIYLACKVEEFNVSIMQFIANLKCNREKALDVILQQELLLMQQLHYHLTVHNTLRPLEGLLIDIKTRCSDIVDPERLRRGADEFIDKSLHTNAVLIFAPSQIALAAVLSSATKIGVNLDSYVANKLLASGGKENLMKTVDHVKRIRFMVKHIELLNRNDIKLMEKKLEKCRGQENNPESDLYKQKMTDLWEEDPNKKYEKRIREKEQEKSDMDLLQMGHLS